MSEKFNVRERVLLTAMRLFYSQGIKSTGINQIIDESHVAKASFYKYFPSKRDLIKECVMEYDNYIKMKLVNIVLDSTSFSNFIKKWNSAIKEDFQIRYRGCPIAEACFQLDTEDPDMMTLLKGIIDGWINVVMQFLQKMIKNDRLPADIDVEKVSRRMVHLYEGAATMWRITNDESYIDDLEYLMSRMLESG
ncbi:MAG TPA: TetR/AcrR family transcriptional regulator [Spirochaetota bacterium]|nr:TetR/AcrR family transcriptional regulator [Spirochaetota bacterium]HPF05626.1 TetR/AcrR family transcriptional regulator [Spirochaetota bacterium]HPJ42787.1 TetR/AcrR family transcriptional regulator [Spirochaetota bacterium]HPR36502.1 TetR/AcrR family transcriptional regulator [Spirochaetota bacterium]HRX47001.1 TetR/AcrR family transcriptional regulator [Spirochaetota bacterium]